MFYFLHTPNTNQLLASLPDVERYALMADCETVELAFGKVLFQPGDTITHVYFPIDSFFHSLQSSMVASGLKSRWQAEKVCWAPRWC